MHTHQFAGDGRENVEIFDDKSRRVASVSSSLARRITNHLAYSGRRIRQHWTVGTSVTCQRQTTTNKGLKFEGAYTHLRAMRSVTCHKDVTCHPTQVNALCLNPRQAGRYSFYLPRKDGRLSWPWCWLPLWFTVCRQSPIQVVSTWGPGVELTTFWSQVQRPNRSATEPPNGQHSVEKVTKIVSFCCLFRLHPSDSKYK